MYRRIRSIHALIAIILASATYAQSAGSSNVVQAKVVDGDTIVVVQLPEAQVVTRWKPRDRREAQRYDKLTKNVVRVYPYAHLTGQLLREYEYDLSRISRESDQGLYIKLAEAELRAEFEAEVKDLTISQGEVLIKLIDRETGRTGFQLVKDLRGGFQAFAWQGLARLFGHDLKNGYDPQGDDLLVEVIVERIERGELPLQARPARTEKAQARLDKRKVRLYRKYGINGQQGPDTSLNQ